MNAHVDMVKRNQLRREREARRGQLGPRRYSRLVKDIVDVICLAFEAGATATLWGLEGPLRAGIRSDLCRSGWGWLAAELLTRDILDEAFRKAGAQRPDWNEGQPEWVIPAGMVIERTRCVRCCGPLPEGHFKFCSRTCSAVYNNHFSYLRKAQQDQAIEMAIRSLT